MVAARIAPRSRAVAVALVLMMVLPALALLPTGKAPPPTNLDITVREIRIGGTDAADRYAKKDSLFDIVVSASADMTPCTGGTLSPVAPRLDVKADLSMIGGSAVWDNGAAMTQVGNTNTWQATVTYQNVKVNSTANGESVHVPLQVSARCRASGAGVAEDPMTFVSTQTTNSFRPDATLPTVTATAAAVSTTDTTVNVGDAFKLTFTGASTDIASHDIDLAQFTASCGAPCNLQSGAPQNVASLSLENTDTENPVGTVLLTDNAGNTNAITLQKTGTFDARPPTAPAVTVGQGADPRLDVSITPHATKDMDLNSVTIRVQPQGGTAVEVVCPGAGCPTPSTIPAGVATTYTLTNAVFTAQGKPAILQRGTTYEVSVRGTDDASNVGPYSTPAVAQKISFTPSATVYVEVLSGKGGIGSTFRLQKNASVDVAHIEADLHRVLTTAQVPDPHKVTFSGPQSNVYTVEATNDPLGSIGLLAVAPDGSFSPATREPVTFIGFDTVRPVAPGQFSVNALTGGAVRAKFLKVADAVSYGLERRVFGTTTWTETLVSAASVTCDASDRCEVDLPASGFTSGTRYEFRLRARDAADNWGAYSAETPSTTPRASPLDISIDPFAPPYGRTFPVVTGDYAVSDAGVNPASAIKVALQDATDLQYWTGTGAQFSAAATWLPVTFASGNEWRADVFANLDASTFPTRGFIVHARIENPSGIPAEHKTQRAFTLDRTIPGPPPSATEWSLNRFSGTGPYAAQAGVTKLGYRVFATDAESGIGKVEFRFFRDATPAFTQQAIDAQGTPFVVTCTATCVSSGTGSPIVGTIDNAPDGEAEYHANVTFWLDRLPVGQYQVRLRVYDNAGNAMTIDESGAADKVRVVPRIRLIADDVKQTTTDTVVLRSPFVDANGLRVTVLSAWDNHTALNPEGPCSLNVCRVTAVEVWGRDRAATGSGAGTLLQNIAFPERGPSQFLKGTTFLATDESYYHDYTPTNPIPVPSSIPLDRLEIRVKAYVTMGTGAANVYEVWTHGTGAAPGAGGTWLRVPTTTTQPGLFFTNPPDDGTVFLSGSPGRVFFNVTFEQIGLDNPSTAGHVPRVEYQVRVVNDPTDPSRNGKFVNFEGTQTVYSDSPSSLGINATWGRVNNNPAIPKGPKFYFNWSNNQSLPRGEYVIWINSTGTDVTRATASRPFAIETVTPLVTLAGATVAQAEIFPATDTGRYVRPVFNVTARVDHGLARLNAAGLSATLLATNAGGGTRVIRQDAEEFRWTVRDFNTLPDGRASYANLTIKLPHNATDGTRYDLRIHAAVESQYTGKTAGGGNLGNVTGVRSIEVDAVPPGSGVFRAATNQTGFNPADELVIKGFAEDRGSGVQAVEVRIYDQANDRTFMWNLGGEADGGWTPGLADSWLTSDPRQAFVSKKWVRDVKLEAPVGAVREWSVRADVRPRYDDQALTVQSGAWAPLPLDRNTTYVIDVRARDQLGAFAVHQSFEVRFDTWAPAITAPISLAAGNGWAAWHDTTTKLQVGVQDNQCLRNVTLYGRAEGGRVMGPFDFARPAGAQCGRTTGNAAATWTLDLKNHPGATDEVGRIEYWVEAWDPAGNNVTGTRTVNLTVNDTTPAQVRFLRPEPHVVGVGQPMRIVAEVWENGGIEEVRAFLARINPDSTFTHLAEGVARPVTVSANGTGFYEVETGRDVNATNLTVGSYLWTIRAIDKNRNVTCAQPDGRLACHQQEVVVRVSVDAGLQLQVDSPARGATVVNATPTFQFTVYDRNVTASGITLRAGNSSTNLTTVTPTSVTDALTGGVKAGVVVTYRPNLTEPTFAIQLEATSQGITNKTDVLSYAVDAVAPVVTANLTGTVDVGGKAYATGASRVNITTDGPATITYTVNDAATPIAYAGTFAPTLPAGTEGEWRIEYRATDAAGNVARGTLRAPYDAKEPTINVTKHGDDLLVTVTDTGVGVNDTTVRVHYRYGNDVSSFTTATMQKETGNTYRVQLTGNATATGLRYYFEAKDLLGNTGTRHSAAQPYVIDPEGPAANLEPTLRITSPTPNTGARDQVVLRWLAEDPEGENLTITIALRTPTGGARFIQTAGPDNGTYTVDLRGAEAGTHTLVVTASDGETTAQESVAFVVERGELVEVITPPPVQVEEDRLLAFAVRVNPGARAVSSVTYTLVRDNETVASGGMKLAQGAYTANLVPEDPGRYAVLVTVAYADGTSEPQREVASFTVASREAPSTSGGFPASLITLVVLALATIALAAYAAFVRWPR